MPGELAEVRITSRGAEPMQPERRVPARVEREDLRQRGELLLDAVLRVDHRTGYLQVLVDRLASHEEMHDLARALEDQVDAAIAENALDRDRRLAATRER